MTFAHHAFISYAHLDNTPLKDKGRGWVDVLHTTLVKMIGQQLGEKVDIWRDDRLQGNDDFAGEISDKLPATAVMVSVFTPRYLKSTWCQRELQTFCEVAERSGGLYVGNKARVFRVVKTPPLDGRRDTASLPPALQKTTGYEYYSFDAAQSTYTELDPAYGETEEQEFLRKTRELAIHIAKLLHALEPQTAVPAPAAPAAAAATANPKPVVYLTECSRFHRANRERIATELAREGYVVLPEGPLPTDETELIAEVRALLARAQLSVHLIGPMYGVVPEGTSGKSIGIWQNELAAERAQQAERDGARFERVIWLEKGTVSAQPEQQRLIDTLHGDRQAQRGADLVTDDIEGFKSAIRAALERLERPPPAPPAAAAAAESAQSGEGACRGGDGAMPGSSTWSAATNAHRAGRAAAAQGADERRLRCPAAALPRRPAAAARSQPTPR